MLQKLKSFERWAISIVSSNKNNKKKVKRIVEIINTYFLLELLPTHFPLLFF